MFFSKSSKRRAKASDDDYVSYDYFQEGFKKPNICKD